ncbi:Phage shock protein PspC (stress-responsive transcriptional regulator) [Arthrobacter subterraneus]|uniref:Phage shock protein PspC (Stress-responsive transcriptional regulator) n=1 Tax=Arthrobacter subterraneus TaxID=335973 RepID=A0A1G8CJY4_9MICC|nr:PspC domain-containing protein [Arthrobacter subterraneus]SDH45817.1 Phage shock protein PspC (stress-responsive transcriptional regulator) [Arthrobacter subterraneus]
MNPQENPPPPPHDADGAPHPSSADGPAGPGAGFFGWVRSLRITRGQDRWIGGVATGISARTGLDVVLVRGLFVVLAIFGGIGLLVYGLAWALLPEPDGRIHAESAARGSWTSGMTGALVASLLGLWRPNTPMFGNTGGFGGFIWSLFWIGVAVFIVYWISNSSRNRNDAVPGTLPLDTYSTGSATAGAPPTSNPSGGSASGGTAPTDAFPPVTYPTRPYTAPVRPPVNPKPAIPRPVGSDIAIFLGGALLLAALVLVLDYVGVLTLGGSVIPVALATGVVVLGLGIVLLGIRGRSSGALGFLAAVAIAATMLSSASPLTGNWVLADQGRWSMTAASPAPEGYTVFAGQGRVDLTGLTDLSRDVVIPVSAAAGNVNILVPDNVPVDVRSRLALSSTDLVSAADTTSIGGVWQPRTLHLNEDAEGPRIILDVRGVASHITIATTEDALLDTESGQ